MVLQPCAAQRAGFDADLDHFHVTPEGRGTDRYPKLEY
jgi:hypothetical protein